MEVLGGARGAKRDMVVLNAACGLLAFGACKDLNIAVRRCEGAIDSGRALEKLRAYVAGTTEHTTS
jgi:anthranilate phosphoribosyltransferase